MAAGPSDLSSSNRTGRARHGYRLLLRRLVFQVCIGLQVHRLARWWWRRNPRVLVFHSVVSDEQDVMALPEVHASRAFLERALEHVQRHYQVVPLDMVLSYVDGRSEVPRNAVALTWDDGYVTFQSEVLPLAARHRVPVAVSLLSEVAAGSLVPWDVRLAVAQRMLARRDPRHRRGWFRRAVRTYVSSGPQDRERMLSHLAADLGVEWNKETVRLVDRNLTGMLWQQVADALAEHDVTILAHTASHEPLNTLSDSEMRSEVTRSRSGIQKALGVPCDGFVYPLGVATAAARACVERAGFRFAFTTSGRPVRRGDDRLLLSRIEIAPFASREEFICRVAGVGAWIAVVKGVARRAAALVPGRRPR